MEDPSDDFKNLKIGILGCGAIGSGIAVAIHQGLHPRMTLAGLYDIDPQKIESLSKKISSTTLTAASLNELMEKSDLIVEAINSSDTANVLRQIIQSNKHVLVMSIGQLLIDSEVLAAAEHATKSILIPSGAIAGIDALKAAMIAGIDEITLTTYKPPRGLKGAPFIDAQKISLDDITKETTIFEGSVADAIRAFPQNINVAATLALATKTIDRLRIRIVTSPNFKCNRHTIYAKGSFW